MRATIHWKITLQLRSKLVKSVQNNLSFCHLKSCFQLSFKLHTLFGFKDTLDKTICSHLVYRYSCSSCNPTYHGKSYQYVFTRAAEHMSISNLTGKLVKNVKESVVSDHVLQCDCTIYFDHFDILASDIDSFWLLIKEGLLIKRIKPVPTRTVYSFPFVFYSFSLLYCQHNIFNARTL